MRPFGVAAGVLGGGLLVVTGAARAQVPALGKTVDVGGWQISNEKNATGVQTCSAIHVFDDKNIIGFATDSDYDNFFLVSEPEAKLTEGQQIQVSFNVDRGKKQTGTGIAASGNMIVVPMPADQMDSLYGAFMKGNSLFITLGKQEFEEPLTGSSNAIGAMTDCQNTFPKKKK